MGDEEKITTEINILKTMDHPNVLKIIETFDDNKFIFIVTEKIDGVELFDEIVDRKYFSERDAAIVMK